MKKYFFIAAAALATLASCTQIEKDQPQAQIAFKAYNVKPNTKAPIEGAYYDMSMPNFGVFAAYSTGDAATASDVTYIDNLEVKPNTELEIWEGTTPVYWPLSGSLTFMAYTPKTGVTASFKSDATSKVMTISDYALSTQADLMYTKQSTATGLKANETDYKPAEGTNAQTTKGVDIVFNHSLAQVVVKAKTKEDYASKNTTFKITNVTISGQNTSGTLTVTGDNAAWALSGTTVAQKIEGLTDPFTVPYTDATTFTQVATPGTLVFPQSLTTQTLNVTYTMTYNNVTSEKTVNILLKDGSFDKFEMGKKYILDLTISADEIKYSPRIIDWVNGSEQKYDIPQPQA